MGLIKEPKNVDLSTRSEPWTDQELNDFRKLMKKLKGRKAAMAIKSSTSHGADSVR